MKAKAIEKDVETLDKKNTMGTHHIRGYPRFDARRSHTCKTLH